MKQTIIITECPEKQGWKKNTELCMDVKTFLRSDARMKAGKSYQGVLTRDSDAVIDDFLCRDAHYTFIETQATAKVRRNPRIYDGKYISVTIQDDGTPRPNFKPLKADAGFSADGYALAVCNELRQALNGLIGK